MSSSTVLDKTSIPLYEPTFFGNELNYLKECIDSGWISSAGPLVTQFEQKIAHYLGIEYTVAVNSGTAALHLAMLCSGVGPNDEVVVPAMTFIATANAVRYTGAYPVFVDIDPQYWHLDPNCLLDFLKTACQYKNAKWVNKHTGRTLKGIVPVHLMGNPCDINSIRQIAMTYKLSLIEDAAQSFGATYHDQHTGTFGLAGCLSFNGNKILTCGAGGMIVTHSAEIAKRAKYLSTQARADLKNYIHHEIGYNYRFSNLHAAIGIAQLNNFREILVRKKTIANQYRKLLSEMTALILPETREGCVSNEWLFTPLFKKNSKKTIVALRDALEKKGIQTRALWQPLHQSSAFKGCYHHRISVANDIYHQALSLPSSSHLSHETVGWICRSLKHALKT